MPSGNAVWYISSETCSRKYPNNKFATVESLFEATYVQEGWETMLAKIKDVEHKLRKMMLIPAADMFAGLLAGHVP